MPVYQLNSIEVARRFNITQRTAQRLAEKGELDAIKIGRQWRFNAEALPDGKRRTGDE